MSGEQIITVNTFGVVDDLPEVLLRELGGHFLLTRHLGPKREVIPYDLEQNLATVMVWVMKGNAKPTVVDRYYSADTPLIKSRWDDMGEALSEGIHCQQAALRLSVWNTAFLLPSPSRSVGQFRVAVLLDEMTKWWARKAFTAAFLYDPGDVWKAEDYEIHNVFLKRYVGNSPCIAVRDSIMVMYACFPVQLMEFIHIANALMDGVKPTPFARLGPQATFLLRGVPCPAAPAPIDWLDAIMQDMAE